jgi:hypothetical protein
VKVSPRTVRLAIEAGELEAEHPLSEGPWLVNRRELIGEKGQRISQRAHGTRAAIPSENQRDFQFSST